MKTGGKTVKVGGRRVAVCCDDCATKLKANPAKYLEGCQ